MDGSVASIKASNHAIDMARNLGASFTVLYIISPATYIDLGYANVGRIKETQSTEKKQAQHKVNRVKKKAMEKNVTV